MRRSWQDSTIHTYVDPSPRKKKDFSTMNKLNAMQAIY